jgi:uncharacterized repeat protein (TIGR03847 family)
MAGTRFDMNPVTHITAGAVGQPGQRVFYLQATQSLERVTLLCEKQQIEALAVGIEQFLEELHKKHPDLPEATDYFDRYQMALEEPLEPLFRVGQMGLGYDEDNDLLVLVAQEIVTEEKPAEESAAARFWATRSQLRALSRYALEIVRQGRPICGNCGQPMDPEGHFCPRSNGHQH